MAVCRTVVNSGLDSSFEIFIWGHYGPPSTGRIQQLAYNTNHKRGVAKLLKLLNKLCTSLMVTFENGENCSIEFEVKKNNIRTALVAAHSVLEY